MCFVQESIQAIEGRAQQACSELNSRLSAAQTKLVELTQRYDAESGRLHQKTSQLAEIQDELREARNLYEAHSVRRHLLRRRNFRADALSPGGYAQRGAVA